MSKRLILLSVRGTFTEWGPGCLLNIVTLTDETVNQFAVGVRTGGEWVVLSRHADEKTASGKTVVWLQAILAATDGGLLYWDDERQQVVDELGEMEEAFAEAQLTDELPGVPEDRPLVPCDKCPAPFQCDLSACAPASSAAGSVAPETPLRSDPAFRQGATPWTPSPYYAVPGLDGGRLGTRSKENVLR